MGLGIALLRAIQRDEKALGSNPKLSADRPEGELLALAALRYRGQLFFDYIEMTPEPKLAWSVRLLRDAFLHQMRNWAWDAFSEVDSDTVEREIAQLPTRLFGLDGDILSELGEPASYDDFLRESSSPTLCLLDEAALEDTDALVAELAQTRGVYVASERSVGVPHRIHPGDGDHRGPTSHIFFALYLDGQWRSGGFWMAYRDRLPQYLDELWEYIMVEVDRPLDRSQFLVRRALADGTLVEIGTTDAFASLIRDASTEPVVYVLDPHNLATSAQHCSTHRSRL